MTRRFGAVWVAAALLAGAARGEVVVDVLPAEKAVLSQVRLGEAPGGPVRLDLANRGADEIVAAFNFQTGGRVLLDKLGWRTRREVPAVIYDVALDAPDYPAAVDQLARQLHMAAATTGTDTLLRPDNFPQGLRNPAKPLNRSAVFTQIRRQRTVGPTTKAALQLALEVRPGPLGFDGQPQLYLTQADDEHPRSLLATPAGPPEEEEPPANAGVWSHEPVTLSAKLQSPEPRPRRLTVVGEVVVREPVTVSRLTVSELSDAVQVADFEGTQLNVGPLRREDGAWSLMIDQQDAVLDEQSPTLAAVRCYDAQGRRLQFKALSTVSKDRRGVLLRFAADAGVPFGKPATLCWTRVIESRPVRLPVGLKDVVLP
jgi:hypothetical protein